VSVLLVAAEGGLGDAIVARLLGSGDEVRVVGAGTEDAERWRSRGAHIAAGDPRDGDLVERAAQNVRTIIGFDDADSGWSGALEAAISGGERAGVERIIVCATSEKTTVEVRVSKSPLEYFLLVTGPARGWRTLGSRTVATEAVAVAVDAADDLAGHPRVVLDLRRPEAWRILELAPPPG
jgi:hypothetical protein